MSLSGRAEGLRCTFIALAEQRQWCVLMESFERPHEDDGQMSSTARSWAAGAAAAPAARTHFLFLDMHLHLTKALAPYIGLATAKANASTTQAPHSPRPFSLVSIKRRIKRCEPPLGLASVPQRNGVGRL